MSYDKRMNRQENTQKILVCLKTNGGHCECPVMRENKCA